MEGAKAYRGMSYDEIARSGTTENKAKQNQFEGSPEGVGRRNVTPQSVSGSELPGR